MDSSAEQVMDIFDASIPFLPATVENDTRHAEDDTGQTHKDRERQTDAGQTHEDPERQKDAGQILKGKGGQGDVRRTDEDPDRQGDAGQTHKSSGKDIGQTHKYAERQEDVGETHKASGRPKGQGQTHSGSGRQEDTGQTHTGSGRQANSRQTHKGSGKDTGQTHKYAERHEDAGETHKGSGRSKGTGQTHSGSGRQNVAGEIQEKAEHIPDDTVHKRDPAHAKDGERHIQEDIEYINDVQADGRHNEDTGRSHEGARHAKNDARHLKEEAGNVQKDAEHIQKDVEHIQKDARHIQRDSEHIQKDGEHIQKNAEPIQKDAGHIDEDAGHIQEVIGHTQEEMRRIQADAEHIQEEGGHIQEDGGNSGHGGDRTTPTEDQGSGGDSSPAHAPQSRDRNIAKNVHGKNCADDKYQIMETEAESADDKGSSRKVKDIRSVNRSNQNSHELGLKYTQDDEICKDRSGGSASVNLDAHYSPETSPKLTHILLSLGAENEPSFNDSEFESDDIPRSQTHSRKARRSNKLSLDKLRTNLDTGKVDKSALDRETCPIKPGELQADVISKKKKMSKKGLSKKDASKQAITVPEIRVEDFAETERKLELMKQKTPPEADDNVMTTESKKGQRSRSTSHKTAATDSSVPGDKPETKKGRWRSRIRKNPKKKDKKDVSGVDGSPGAGLNADYAEDSKRVIKVDVVNENKGTLKKKKKKSSEKLKKEVKNNEDGKEDSVGLGSDGVFVDDVIKTGPVLNGDKIQDGNQDDVTVMSENISNEAKSSVQSGSKKKSFLKSLRALKLSIDSGSDSQSAENASDAERNDENEDGKDTEEDEREEEKTIEQMEQDSEFMEEFEALVALRRDKGKRGSKRRRRSPTKPSDAALLGAGYDSGGTTPATSNSRSRSRSHSRQVLDPYLIRENLRLQKEVISSVRQQPLHMRKKLKTVRLAKSYIMRYEGKLSRSQGYQEAGFKFWMRFKRELLNLMIFFIPWEMRIKLIESHFGSVVASYFTFLRWLFWVNIILTVLTVCFVLTPEVMVGADFGSTPRKSIPDGDMDKALNLDTVWNFEGYLKVSVLFYGYYGNEETLGNGNYRLPLAYLLTGGATFVISFFIILRKMSKNARMNKMSMKDEQYTFSWKAFASWDFMIGNSETSKNKVAEIYTSFRESILEEEERTRKENKYALIALRVIANILVAIVLASSTYAIYEVVEKSKEVDARVLAGQTVGWLEQNMVALVTSVITSIFPSLFELIGLMEKYHPRLTLRWQLARILVLYLLNLYTLVVALYWKMKDRTDKILSRRANVTVAVLCSNTTMAPDVTAYQSGDCISVTSPTETASGDTICWETELGQEMFKLTTFDLVITVLQIILIDFLRGLAVRYFNTCCCWDLERKFPEYGEFKLAENLLHLINNQAMVWLGTFYAPVLPGLNVFKLFILVYVRSWAVLMCNIPHERIFKASRSNNFYLALLLLMLFLVTVLFIFLIIQLPPSPDCGPFSDYDRSYYVLTEYMEQTFPAWVNSVLDYVASPGAILPLFLLLTLSIFYLMSLTGSLKEANKDLRAQLVHERTEEKRKVYAMADAVKDKMKEHVKETNDVTQSQLLGQSQEGGQNKIKMDSLPSTTQTVTSAKSAFLSVLENKKGDIVQEMGDNPAQLMDSQLKDKEDGQKKRSFAKFGRLIKLTKWSLSSSRGRKQSEANEIVEDSTEATRRLSKDKLGIEQLP